MHKKQFRVGKTNALLKDPNSCRHLYINICIKEQRQEAELANPNPYFITLTRNRRKDHARPLRWVQLHQKAAPPSRGRALDATWMITAPFMQQSSVQFFLGGGVITYGRTIQNRVIIVKNRPCEGVGHNHDVVVKEITRLCLPASPAACHVNWIRVNYPSPVPSTRLFLHALHPLQRSPPQATVHTFIYLITPVHLY